MNILISIIFNIFASMSLETWGLYMVLGVSPYLLITPLIAYFKYLYRDKKVYVLYIITIFFAMQEPFLNIIKKEEIVFNKEQKDSLENRKKQLEKDNVFLLKKGAYGLYKNNSQEILNIKKEISKIDSKKIKRNNYASFTEILIIFLVEYMLFIQLKYFLKKREVKKNEEIVGDW